MTERSAKRPSFQWYPGDAQRDTALRACCLEARGLWREMLDLMHDGEPYGYLTAGGVPIGDAQLARMVGITAKRCTVLLTELEQHGIYSRTEEGVIYSRRMVRDERIRKVRAASGRLGGNPDLVKQRDNQGSNQTPTPATANGSLQSAAAEPLVEVAAATALATAANQGLAEHPVRPQAIPRIFVTSASTQSAVDAILGYGVPLEFARRVVYATAKAHNADGEVSSLKYFVKAVQRAWDQEQAGDRLRPAPPNPEDAAEQAFDRVTATLKQFGDLRFIPREKMDELYSDARIKAALKAVGGLPGIRDCKPDKMVWLKKDFVKGYQKASAA